MFEIERLNPSLELSELLSDEDFSDDLYSEDEDPEEFPEELEEGDSEEDGEDLFRRNSVDEDLESQKDEDLELLVVSDKITQTMLLTRTNIFVVRPCRDVLHSTARFCWRNKPDSGDGY